MLITPSQVHMAFDVLFKAGKLFILTVGDPGIHGLVVTGTQGTGVATPSFAAVAAMKAGFVGAMHITNVGIFAIGAKSMIVAAIGPAAFTGGPFGIATSEVGADPNVHMSDAPIATS